MKQYGDILLAAAASAAAMFVLWERWLAISFILRLILTFIIGLILIFYLVRYLAKRERRLRGTGFTAQTYDDGRDRKAKLSFVAVISIAAVLIAASAWLQIDYFAIKTDQAIINGQRVFTITAATRSVSTLSIPVPLADPECEVREAGATLQIVDWGRPRQLIRARNFHRPQKIWIRCPEDVAGLLGRGVSFNGEQREFTLTDQIILYRGITFFMGAALWLFGLFHLRRASLV